MASSRGIRPSRTKSQRHPLLADRPANVWHEDLVGIIKGYPKTLEAFEKRRALASVGMKKAWAEGKIVGGRKGVPDGWAKKKKQLMAVRARGATKAEEIYQIMAAKGLIVPSADMTDDEAAKLGIKFAIETLESKEEREDGTVVYAYPLRDRQAAAALLLRYTKAMPATVTKVKLERAEDFLASLAAEDKTK